MKLLLVGAFFAIFSNACGNSSQIKRTPYNITGKWFLPNPTSPVFYLHFRDRISWIEADAVCQFHHSQLVTVNTATQYEDVRSYLSELYYEEPIWIGLKRNSPQGLFQWTDDSPLSTDEYWKETPSKEEKLCVTASPADNYRWTARQCNGPDVASFVCEMPIPKWVQKSACLDSLNPLITITFHPEKSMIKAGKVCPNKDVKYIECHDMDNVENSKENIKILKQQLDCQFFPKDSPSNLTSINTNKMTTTATSTPVSTSNDQITFTDSQRQSTTSFGGILSNITNTLEYSSSLETEFYNKNSAFSEGIYELSTISLPREMSFAEEPIKASKPFLPKDPTEQPERNNSSTEALQHKSSSNVLNLIPTSIPIKIKPEKASVLSTELAKENDKISVYAMFSTTAPLFLNATPVEESHEVYNNDKNREIFQDSAVVKKSIKMEVVENIGNSLKNIASKSSESEEEVVGDRTYNIEGTFDANDFVNPEPINVYKKIDLTPLESATTDISTTELKGKSTETTLVSAATKNEVQLQTTPSPSASSTTEIQAAFTANSTTTHSWTTQNHKVTQNGTATSQKIKLTPIKRSPLLSGAQDSEDEPTLSNRKRRVINSERHSFYPYFLGRILG